MVLVLTIKFITTKNYSKNTMITTSISKASFTLTRITRCEQFTRPFARTVYANA